MLVVVLRKNQIKKIKFFKNKNLYYYLYIIYRKILLYKIKIIKGGIN